MGKYNRLENAQKVFAFLQKYVPQLREELWRDIHASVDFSKGLDTLAMANSRAWIDEHFDEEYLPKYYSALEKEASNQEKHEVSNFLRGYTPQDIGYRLMREEIARRIPLCEKEKELLLSATMGLYMYNLADGVSSRAGFHPEHTEREQKDSAAREYVRLFHLEKLKEGYDRVSQEFNQLIRQANSALRMPLTEKDKQIRNIRSLRATMFIQSFAQVEYRGEFELQKLFPDFLDSGKNPKAS